MAAGPKSTPAIEQPKPSGTPRILTRRPAPGGLLGMVALVCSVKVDMMKSYQPSAISVQLFVFS
jgi:hypothetical protein